MRRPPAGLIVAELAVTNRPVIQTDNHGTAIATCRPEGRMADGDKTREDNDLESPLGIAGTPVEPDAPHHVTK